MVLDSLDLGGAERHVVDLSGALARRGHTVTVAAGTGGPLAAHLTVPVRVVMSERIKRTVSPRYAYRLRRIVAEGFDVVHAHMYASSVAAALAGGAPLVITEHSEGSWQGAIARYLNGWACRRAARVAAVSEPIARRMVTLGVPAERVEI